MNVGAFAVTLGVGRDLTAFVGLGRANPWAGAAMVVFLLSLVGVPPFAGFAGKLLLFGAAIDAGMTWLAVIAVLNSVLSLAVYLRIIVPMYRSSAYAPNLIRPVVAVSGITLAITLAIGVGVEFVTNTVRP
jgi:NADH:ubiquinone oxidoreductase subunit 2 (subunit N)